MTAPLVLQVKLKRVVADIIWWEESSTVQMVAREE
jgi:hypothetical protein